MRVVVVNKYYLHCKIYYENVVLYLMYIIAVNILLMIKLAVESK